jgi:hypothetical protein
MGTRENDVEDLQPDDYPVTAPRKRGRPSKLTKPVMKKIIGYLEAGNHRATSARAAGVSRSSFHRWVSRGAIDKSAGTDSIYRDFRDAIKKAEARFEVEAVRCVLDASETKWTAAMTLLERRWPQRWSRGERRDLSVEVEPAVQADVSMLTDAELRVAKQIAALTQNEPDHIESPEVFVDSVEALLLECREQIRTGERRRFPGAIGGTKIKRPS